MTDVSRETPSAPPAVPGLARRVFGERLPLAEQYAAVLADAGVERGLIGPRETPRLWERHLLNCASLAEAIPEHATVGDVGSGAGLPGVVLAIARADLEVTLIEPLLRRSDFLTEVVDRLGLSNARVVRARAEDLGAGAVFDVVTARAVAPLSRLLGWTMPLVTRDGQLLAMKGSSAQREVDDASAALRRLGCAPPEILVLGDPSGPSTATVVRVVYADRARVS